jgi:hypothetical protein
MWEFLKWMLLSHLLVFTLSSQATADMLSDAKLLDAKRTYFTGDFEKTEKIIRHMVEQGDAAAQNILGVMYFNGQGVEQDFQEAARLYLLSATQGNGTIRRQQNGTDWLQSRDMHLHKITLVYYTGVVKVWSKTTRKRQNYTNKLQSRVMPMHSITLGCSTAEDKE